MLSELNYEKTTFLKADGKRWALWLAFDFLQKQKHLKNPTKHTLSFEVIFFNVHNIDATMDGEFLKNKKTSLSMIF
jgi:hypothetical protein